MRLNMIGGVVLAVISIGVAAIENVHEHPHLRQGRALLDQDVFYSGSNHCTKDKPCKECEGDCDNDDQCDPNLRCWQRDPKGVFGGDCGGGVDDGSRADFCYDPLKQTNPPAPVKNLLYISYQGNSHCTKRNPCPECVGDCDSDDDCDGTLECGQRDEMEPAPGCDGGLVDNSRGDYCYDTSKVSSTPNSPPPTPAPTSAASP